MFDEENERKLTAELAKVERQLRGLTPTAPRIDRDRLMFAAGQASSAACIVGPGRDGRAIYIAGPSWAGRRFWPAATATMTAATILLSTMLVWRNQSPPVVQQEVKPHAVELVPDANKLDDDDETQLFTARQTWSTQPPATSGYLGVRYVALTRGVGAMLELQPSNDERDLPSDDRRTTPATARGLLDQLLPAPAPSKQSRS